MMGESAGKLLSKVPLTSKTFRIQHIAEGIYDQLIESEDGCIQFVSTI
jgi:hypothetical protein